MIVPGSQGGPSHPAWAGGWPGSWPRRPRGMKPETGYQKPISPTLKRELRLAGAPLPAEQQLKELSRQRKGDNLKNNKTGRRNRNGMSCLRVHPESSPILCGGISLQEVLPPPDLCPPHTYVSGHDCILCNECLTLTAISIFMSISATAFGLLGCRRENSFSHCGRTVCKQGRSAPSLLFSLKVCGGGEVAGGCG